MPRKAREKAYTGIYHVILRGNNKQIIFETVEDYEKFLELLKLYKEECGFKLFAYCLMDNHIHLLVGETKMELHSFIARIAGHYAKWYNFKYRRYGYLFQDRFKSEPVNDVPYFLTVFRYILQNPYKAKLVASIADYQWSSYHALKNIDSSFVDIYELLNCFQNKKECMKYLHEQEQAECMEYTSSKRLEDADAIAKVLEISGLDSVSQLQQIAMTKRNQIIRKILKHGIPVKQMARITGISTYIIKKIKNRR